jgi:uncharacterized lipoprotein YddW (UPF0748 family)
MAPAAGRAAAALLVMLAGCAGLSAPMAGVASAPPAPAAAFEGPAPAPREFRGAWVASVANIDWPTQPGLSAQVQRAQAVAILDRALEIGLNALILQVRAAGDALYPSPLEPWSEALSGVQGKGPQPAYDPLAFWVEQAHRRGLELHAWFNPYRARHSSAKGPLAATHLGMRRPELVRPYGDQLWFDPGEAAAAAQLLAVVADVVRRYDIDGVHIDDYFYPYPVTQGGVDLPFPDDETYARYRLADGPLARDDWRRANVDALVQSLYRSVHEAKPWVRVGISPFGIGRPERRAAGVAGFSQFDRLHADVERWLASGWLDYLAPQLYWTLASETQPFAVLLDSWRAENILERHLWPGLYTSQVARSWPATELLDQIALLRTRKGATGHIHFSMSALMQDREGLATRLHGGPYAEPALVPASPWLAAAPPAPPQLRARGSRVVIDPAVGPAAARWAVWRRIGGQWRFSVLPPQARDVDTAGADAIVVCAVDRAGMLSERSVLQLR